MFTHALVIALVAAAPGPLDAARDAFSALRYPQAKTALAAVGKSATGLTRDQVVEYYTMLALTQASLGEGDAAQASFTTLLSLDPTYKIKGSVAPKVSTPFFEAKAKAQEQGAIAAHVDPVLKDGKATITLSGPFATMGKTVRVDVTEAGASAPQKFPVAATISVPCKTQCEVTASLLNDAEWVIATSGVVTVKEAVAAPVAVTTPTNMGGSTPPPPPAVIVTAPQPEGPRLRPLAIGLGVTGLAVLIGAGVCGGISDSARKTFTNATRDADGTITGLTRQQAIDNEATMRTTGLLANVGFGLGGALIAGAIVTWFVGNTPTPAPVAFMFTGNGVGMAMELP